MRDVTTYFRQLLVPSGLMLLFAFAADRLGMSKSFSIAAVEVSVVAIGIAAVALAWRFQLPRIALAVATVLLITRGASLFSPASEPIAHGCMLTFLAIAGPVNLAFLLLIDDSAFDLESLAWWSGVVAVEAVLLYAVARSEPLGVVRWLRLPFSDARVGVLGHLSPLFVVVFLCVAALLVGASLSRKPVDFSLVWAAVAIPMAFPLLPNGGEAIYLAASVMVLGAGVLETSYAVAYHDELTGLPGRRAYNRYLEHLNGQYAIAVVDIDHFKKFNDTYGHDIGDQVLRMVAGRLARVTGGGRSFRCGGEEFAIVFPRISMTEAADHLEMLREDIELSPFIVRGPDRSKRERPERRQRHDAKKVRSVSIETTVTVSIGVAEVSGDLEPQDVIIRADRALYQAKEQGRNRVVCSSQPGRGKRRDDPIQVGRRSKSVPSETPFR